MHPKDSTSLAEVAPYVSTQQFVPSPTPHVLSPRPFAASRSRKQTQVLARLEAIQAELNKLAFKMQKSTPSSGPDHLIVLAHGLAGTSQDLDYLKRRQPPPPPLYRLNPRDCPTSPLLEIVPPFTGVASRR